MRRLFTVLLAAIGLLAPVSSSATPRVDVHGGAVTGAGDGYRARFVPESAGFQLDVRDGENDGSAAEYDQVVELPIAAGRHRLTLDNQGADWLAISHFQFDGRWANW